MKTVLLFLPALLCTFAVRAQHGAPTVETDTFVRTKTRAPRHHETPENFRTDVSIHGSAQLGEKTKYHVKVWGVHLASNRLVTDVHAGFHFANTIDASLGYNTVKKNDIWLVPKLSILGGEYFGFAPGLLFRLERKHWYIFSETEYITNIAQHKPHAVFNFTEVGRGFLRYFETGFISETRIELEHNEWAFTHTHVHYDVGPVLRFNIKSIYIEGWWAINPLEMHECRSLHESSSITLAFGWKFNRCTPDFTPPKRH